MNREAPTDLNTPHTGTLSEDLLRSVLRDWDSLAALGSHPLASLGIVENCRQAAKYTPTPTGRGLALRKVIQSAIDTLKPDGESPEVDEKNWRRFTILQEQFLHARSPEWVAQQLHVSKGTYYGEQKRALQILADLLRKWEEERPHLSINEASPHPEPPQPVTNVPFMVPVRPPHFVVGRDKLLGDLVLRLRCGFNKGLVGLVGLPGVGKTTTAIELAHHPEILEHFRDGILWAGLGREPDLAALLARWATAVGAQPEVNTNHMLYGLSAPPEVSAERLLYGVGAPPKVGANPTLYGVGAHTEVIANRNLYGIGVHTDMIAERAAAIHTAIGMRRLLLIIDDAWSAEAALAFKVGGPNCAYLLTTRFVNIALDFTGDQVLTVDELDLDEGLNLLTQMATPAVEADPDTAHALVQQVGGLPLALILMGQHLQKQSYHAQPRRMREALDELQTARARLELAQPQSALELRADLPPNTPLTLQTSIGLSDATLDDSAHRALVALALFAPKPNTFSEEAALAVTQAPTKILDRLVDCGLMESLAPDRYTIHQTIVDYASLETAEPAARERLVNYFANYAEKQAAEPQALDLELGNLLKAAEVACEANLYAPLIRLAQALYFPLERRGLSQLAERLLSQANTAASALGDSKSQVRCLSWLGEIALKQGESTQAKTYLEQAVAIVRKTQQHHLEKEPLEQIRNLGGQ